MTASGMGHEETVRSCGAGEYMAADRRAQRRVSQSARCYTVLHVRSPPTLQTYVANRSSILA